MPIEVYSVVEGQRVDESPTRDVSPGAGVGADEHPASGTDAPGATDQTQAGSGQPSASPTETPPAEGGEPSAGDTDDDEPLRDDSEITAARLERRFKRLTAARRQAERERDALAQQHQVELAQTRGQLEALQRMMQGAAPDLPQTPAPPTGPPQAEQYASHEDFVLAAGRYGAWQEAQQDRQQQQQMRFQQDLMSREQAFKQAHPDFDTVVRGGLAGKVSPVLQQALMLVPDGPAVAYTLAQQPELVQRLNSLPPPLVLVELGRLSPAPQPTTPTPAVGSTNGTTTPAPTPAHGPGQALHAPETPLSGAGGGAPVLAYRDDMSMDEYKAWRKRTSTLPAWKER